MLVNYEDSSSEENEETTEKELNNNNKTSNVSIQNQPTKEDNIQKINPITQQKPKIKLMGLQSAIRQGNSSNNTTSIISNKTNSGINKSSKIEEEQPPRLSCPKDVNVKRRMATDEDYCTTEQKYHKLNDRRNDQQEEEQEQRTANNINSVQLNQQHDSSSVTVKTKAKKTLFIPPQARGRSNVTTEY